MKRLRVVLFILLVFIPPVSAKTPEGYLSIPSIGLYKSIGFVENSNNGYDLTDLQYGVARLGNTTWGRTDAGRTVLVGHTPGGFEDLIRVQIGDRIIVLMGQDAYSFEVFDTYIAERSDDSILVTPPSEYEVVLLTCYGDTHSLIVKAK